MGTRDYLGYMSWSRMTFEGSQGKNSKQEPGRRNWNRSHREALFTDLLSECCSAYFLIKPKTNFSGVALPLMAWILQYLSLIKEMLLFRLASRLIWWRHFLNWDFLFSEDPSLCWQRQTNTHKNNSIYFMPLNKRSLEIKIFCSYFLKEHDFFKQKSSCLIYFNHFYSFQRDIEFGFISLLWLELKLCPWVLGIHLCGFCFLFFGVFLSSV